MCGWWFDRRRAEAQTYIVFGVAFRDIDAVKDALLAHETADVADDADGAVMQLHLVVQKNFHVCHVQQQKKLHTEIAFAVAAL